MIEALNGRASEEEMKKIQLDVLDVQARESLDDMIKCVNLGNIGFDIDFALKILKNWDFKFTKDSQAASIFEMWEFYISTYMHETKIVQKETRRSLSSHP
jgi:acyl-homoserine lactone acylase PvdQ